MSFLNRLTRPLWPAAAVGLSGDGASLVALDRRRDALVVRRAGYVPLPAGLVRPGFDEQNVADPAELADHLRGLAVSTGLQKRRRWSVALPEAATRTAILTLESASASRAETEEMLRWKIERTFGASADELRVSRRRLPEDAQGRARYLASATHLSVLSEYESAFAALGWHAGLVLPRHFGEGWWLARARDAEDSLLVSSHAEGFTASLLRAGQILLVRSVACEAEDAADELYRFLLFYRDRLNAPEDVGGPARIGRVFAAGDGLTEQETTAIIEETLEARPRPLRAEDVRLSLPSADLDFAQIAAPAGLAALAFG
jgi:Tfp pilus assembly PilM family ATPase